MICLGKKQQQYKFYQNVSEFDFYQTLNFFFFFNFLVLGDD